MSYLEEVINALAQCDTVMGELRATVNQARSAAERAMQGEIQTGNQSAYNSARQLKESVDQLEMPIGGLDRSIGDVINLARMIKGG